MRMDNDYPTVELRKLVDESKFHDSKFEAYVREFMKANMPGFPMGILDTDSDIAHERWEMEPDQVHEVVKVYQVTCQCCGCEQQFTTDQVEPCCTDDENKPIPFDKVQRLVYVIKNTNTNEYLDMQGYIRHESLREDYNDVEIDDGSCMGWDDESDAQAAAETADQAYHNEHGHENAYGFPWAHSWAFLPDRWISTASLKAAGFRVADYTGGAGGRHDDVFRLAGIDGGGYDFSLSHYSRLVAIHCQEKGMWVETCSGPAYVTMDYRADLEKISAALDGAIGGK